MSLKGFFEVKRKEAESPKAGAFPEPDNMAESQILFRKKLEYIKESPADMVQGRDECPICGGPVDYTWTRFGGFTQFECREKDCLPWPIGGAKGRRENGEPKLVPERYRGRI